MNSRMYYSKEAEQRAMRERVLVIAIVSLVGIAVGSVIMLLLAPQSGDETRQNIGKAVGDAVERSSEATQAAVKQLNDEIKELRQRIDSR